MSAAVPDLLGELKEADRLCQELDANVLAILAGLEAILKSSSIQEPARTQCENLLSQVCYQVSDTMNTINVAAEKADLRERAWKESINA